MADDPTCTRRRSTPSSQPDPIPIRARSLLLLVWTPTRGWRRTSVVDTLPARQTPVQRAGPTVGGNGHDFRRTLIDVGERTSTISHVYPSTVTRLPLSEGRNTDDPADNSEWIGV